MSACGGVHGVGVDCIARRRRSPRCMVHLTPCIDSQRARTCRRCSRQLLTESRTTRKCPCHLPHRRLDTCASANDCLRMSTRPLPGALFGELSGYFCPPALMRWSATFECALSLIAARSQRTTRMKVPSGENDTPAGSENAAEVPIPSTLSQ